MFYHRSLLLFWMFLCVSMAPSFTKAEDATTTSDVVSSSEENVTFDPLTEFSQDPEQALPLPPLPEAEEVVEENATQEQELPPPSPPPEREHAAVDSTILYSEVPPWDRALDTIAIGMEYGFYSPLNSSTGTLDGQQFRQALVSVDWLPLRNSTSGELALGGHIGFQYGTSSRFGVALSDTSTAGVLAGVQARYAFRFWNLQPVVPVAAFRFAYVYEQSKNSQLLYAPSGGLWIYLNFFDRRLASEMYTDSGVAHTYLTAEAQYVISRGDTTQVQALNLLVGLRFEI